MLVFIEPGTVFPTKLHGANQRLRSACTYTQAEQSLRCPTEDALDFWISTECLAKTLIIHCRDAQTFQGLR